MKYPVSASICCVLCQNRERPNWATSLKWTFFQYDFRNVWLYNGQGHVDVFLKYLEKGWVFVIIKHGTIKLQTHPKCSFSFYWKKKQFHSEYNLFWIDFPYGYVLSSFWCFKQYLLIEDCRHKGIGKSERLFRMWNCNIGEKMKYVSYKLSSTT